MPAPRKFIHSIKWYAQQYGISASKAKRLSMAGVNLDDPDAMSAFRADKRPRKGVGKNNYRCTPTQPELVENQADPLRAEVERHMGMSSGIKRLQAVEVLLALDYEDARSSRNMKLAKACREEWLAVFEQLRRVESTNPEVEKSKKESVAISEVKIEVHRAYSRVRSALDALPDRLTHKAVGLDASAMRIAVQREITVICRYLVEWEDLKRGQS